MKNVCLGVFGFMKIKCLSINLAYRAADSKSQCDKSDLLQNMHNLDVAVLITSNMDCDLKGKIPQESDFWIGQHQN